ncbi:MAG TPA: dockerin type I domain-containing protein [Tepidisphaeraceae bacterium]|nr:dockerin type I domain-containing protein [Tepidisphaeraceae bacterium]
MPCYRLGRTATLGALTVAAVFNGSRAGATDIRGIQPAALDQPRINALLVQPGATPNTGALWADFFGDRLFNVEAFLDTGASGVVISANTYGALGLTGRPDLYNPGVGNLTYPANGQNVYFEDVGVAGQHVPRFNVSNPVNIAIGQFTPTNTSRIKAAEEAFSSGGTLASTDFGGYTQTVANVRAQVGPFIGEDPSDPNDNPLVSDLDVFGMPLIKGRVMVMDPRPVEKLMNGGQPAYNEATGEQEDIRMRTYLYAPGTPWRPLTVDSDPGIPLTTRSVRVSKANFNAFSKVGTAPTPDGALTPIPAADRDAYLPTLNDNPFLGPNPLAPAGDTTPPVALTFNGKRTTGSFLLDTGAAASMISNGVAANLNVRYRPGTQGTDAPILETFNPANPGAVGTPIGDQFALTIGGIDGTKKVSGFWLSSMVLKTLQGDAANDDDAKHLRFLESPVLVTDISVLNDVTGQKVTLDGIFGMNNIISSIWIGEPLAPGFPIPDLQDLTPSPFDWAVYDDPNSLLSFKLRTPGDADRDGKVSLNDLVILANRYGSEAEAGDPYKTGDFDGNGVISLNDLVILANHYGMSDVNEQMLIDLPHYAFDIFGGAFDLPAGIAPVPEPGGAIVAIALLAAPVLSRRRRRPARPTAL